MKRNVLLHCSDPRCVNLVYLDESISGELIPSDWRSSGEGPHGHYCLDCARRLGYRTKDDRLNAEIALKEAGMLRRPGDRIKKPVKPRPPRLTPGQQTLGLDS